MMNADLNRQWRRTIRDMSSPQVAEAMACLDPAGSPGRQRPMSASAAVRVLLWAIQSIPRREAPDERLRSLASQWMTSITSALARAELPEHVLSSVDADLHCANQALRELRGSSARPIVLGKPDHRDERTAKASSPDGTTPSATDQSPAAYRIMHDLMVVFVLYLITVLLSVFMTIMIIAWITEHDAPPTAAGFWQAWVRAAGLLGDLTPLTLPVTTLIISMLSIPILTGNGRSASLEDRSRQLFLNRAIHVASLTVAFLSILTMPNSPSTGAEAQLQGIISNVIIVLFAILLPTLVKRNPDERLSALHRAEEIIARINTLIPENLSAEDCPARSVRFKVCAFLPDQASCTFVIIFAIPTVTIFGFSAFATHELTHSTIATGAYLPSLTVILLFFLAYSTRTMLQARWSTEIYDAKQPRTIVAFCQTVLFSILMAFSICLPLALARRALWFLIPSIALTALQIAFVLTFHHFHPCRERALKQYFFACQRRLNELTVEAEREGLRDQGLGKIPRPGRWMNSPAGGPA